ncbi:TonB-dependent receptor domain-containing protein, partial [Neisseria sp. HMSC31F04]|uniref:TonB-dependent receptor domain-containing protein n=1 Tax=Neisseria sp. HMSC31F04 TaxID=1581075 RepID=UPI000AE51BC5
MAELYRPGEQVPNSNVASRSLLVKNNWYLLRNQQINLHYMDTKIRFGEINPFINTLLIEFSGLWNNTTQERYEIVPIQGIDSNIHSRTYKLGYQWQPEGSRWIDLKADLWRVNTTSIRHQSGGPDLAVPYGDPKYDAWAHCFRHNVEPDLVQGYSCQDLLNEGYNADTPPNDPPMFEGANTVFAGSRQTTKVSRTGFNLSNRMRLSDQFSLTLSGRHQYEKLDESSIMANNDKDIFGIMNAVTALTKLTGPRAGQRKEWGAQLSFDWRTTSRLRIEAGIRYDRFWAFDDALARARARRDPIYSVTQGIDNVISGLALPYLQVMTQEEIDAYNRAKVELQNRPNDWEEIYRDFYRRHGFLPDDGLSRHNQDGNTSYVDSNDQYQDFDESQTVLYRPMPARISHYRDRKFSGPVFENGFFEQRVENPQGRQGSFYRHLRVEPGSYSRSPTLDITHDSYRQSMYTEGVTFGNNSDYRTRRGDIASTDNEKEAGRIYTDIDPNSDANFPPVKRMNGSAWSPMIALSYDLTDNSRPHLRWAQMTRFPSIYETTNMSAGAVYKYPMLPSIDLKPERSTNWEIGYSYNFAPLWSRLREGDVRLTYFSNTIKNVIDTNENKDLMQYDRKITQCIELQSRLDFGRFFMSLGGTYRLKQETCDANLAFAYDIFYNSAPTCIEGAASAPRGSTNPSSPNTLLETFAKFLFPS